jgi:hypothetical protein
MTLNPKQKELIKLISTCDSTLAEGGGRSGKTMAIMRYIFARAIKFPNTDHLIGRLRFSHAKQSICFQTVPKLQVLMKCNFSRYLNRTDWFYHLPNDSRVWIGGFDDKERTEKILGNEYATILFNEASQIPYDTVEMVSTRLNPPHGVPGKLLYDYNPPSKSHWGYKIFHERKFPDGRPVPEHDFKWIKMNPVDNPHVSKQYIETVSRMSAAKRLRFLDGDYGSDMGTLWKRAWINYDNTERDYQRIVVAVDPSGSVDGDEIGIVAAGKYGDEYTVLDDYSLHGTPSAWAAEAVSLYKKWKADVMVAESNFGGDMVAHTINTVDRTINVKLTHSSRGKIVRAEPISALYEKGMVKHRKFFNDLEDEYCNFDGAGKSPNRLDAAVFALTELSGHSGTSSSSVGEVEIEWS